MKIEPFYCLRESQRGGFARNPSIHAVFRWSALRDFARTLRSRVAKQSPIYILCFARAKILQGIEVAGGIKCPPPRSNWALRAANYIGARLFKCAPI